MMSAGGIGHGRVRKRLDMIRRYPGVGKVSPRGSCDHCPMVSYTDRVRRRRPRGFV